MLIYIYDDYDEPLISQEKDHFLGEKLMGNMMETEQRKKPMIHNGHLLHGDLDT